MERIIKVIKLKQREISYQKNFEIMLFLHLLEHSGHACLPAGSNLGRVQDTVVLATAFDHLVARHVLRSLEKEGRLESIDIDQSILLGPSDIIKVSVTSFTLFLSLALSLKKMKTQTLFV